MLTRLTIKAKFTTLFLLVVFMILAFGVASIYYMSVFQDKIDKISKVAYPMAQDANQLDRDVKQIHSVVTGLMNSSSPEYIDEQLALLMRLQENFSKKIQDFSRFVQSHMPDKNISLLEKTWQDFSKTVYDAVQARRKKAIQENRVQQLLLDTDAQNTAVKAMLTTFVDENLAEANLREESAKIMLQTGQATVESLGELIAQIYDQEQPMVQGASKSLHYLDLLKTMWQKSVILTHADQLPQLRQNAAKIIKKIKTRMKITQNRAVLEGDHRTCNEIIEQFLKLEAMVTGTDGLFQNQRIFLKLNSDIIKIQSLLSASTQRFDKSLDELMAGSHQLNQTAHKDVSVTIVNAGNILSVMMLLCILAGISAILIIIRSVIRPIYQTVGGVQQIANGDLSVRIGLKRNDEIGILSDSIDTAAAVLEGRTRDLEKEVSRRKKDQERLRKAIKEAEAASKAKSEFLANMSHEIRTPMNGIIGMAELALDTPLDKNQEDLINTISMEAESLLSIINSILDFSKIEAGKLELELAPFNLRHLFEDLVTIFAVTAEKKGLELIAYLPPDLPENLVGDPGRLRQIMVNIVGNALKFTHKGEVYVRAEKTADQDGRITVLFSVRDTGIGISKEAQEIIFDSFSQEDGSTSRKYGGTGLGTSIAKQLVELMGGSMRLESSPGEGSTFWFDLVFQKEKGPESRKRSQNLPQGMHILVVDDNQTNRSVFRRYLEAMGATPLMAEDGITALDILSGKSGTGQRVDMVLSDIQMKEMDGFELARKICDLYGEKQIPVIILTSLGYSSTPEKLKQAGLAGSLNKPVRMGELKEAILTVLERGTMDQNGTAPLPQPPEESAPPPRDFHILLAEDYPTNQQIAINHLTSAGYHVTLAEDGAQAVDLFKKNPFDLVLMDIQMPVLDGYEATRLIRDEEEPLKRTPIIAMTAHAVKGYRKKCLEGGMDDYITKPLKRKDLIRLVEKWTRDTGGSPGETRCQTTPPAHPAQTKVLDLETAMDELEGDRAFFIELITEFLNNLPRQINTMEAAARTKDCRAIAEAAHAVKGGAANLTAIPLSDAAMKLERSAKNKDPESIGRDLAALNTEFQRLKTFCQTL